MLAHDVELLRVKNLAPLGFSVRDRIGLHVHRPLLVEVQPTKKGSLGRPPFETKRPRRGAADTPSPKRMRAASAGLNIAQRCYVSRTGSLGSHLNKRIKISLNSSSEMRGMVRCGSRRLTATVIGLSQMAHDACLSSNKVASR